MEKGQSAGLVQKKKRDWKIGALWIAATVLIVVILVPVFGLIWKDRTRTHTQQECELIADALLKQSANDKESMSEWMRNMRQMNCARNALAGWAYVYGGADEEEISEIYDDAAEMPEGVALLQGDDYHVLLGEFPREEFDKALKAREELDGLWAYSVGNGDDASRQGGYLGGTAALTVDGDEWYYSADLRLSDAMVISKSPADSLVVTNTELDLLALIGEKLSDSDVDIVLVNPQDNTVQTVKGDVNIAEGDVLEAEPDQNGSLKIGDTLYVTGKAENSDFRLYAMVPEASISSKGVLSPVIPALMFALVYLLTVLYAWFLRIDIVRGRVEQEKRSGSEDMFGILIRHVHLMFTIIAVSMIFLLIVGSALFVIDDTRVWGYRILTDIENYYREDDQNAAFVAYARESGETMLTDKISHFLDGKHGRQQDIAFEDLGLAVQKGIFLLNQDGTVKAASTGDYDFSSLWDDESELASLKSVLEGKADHKEAIVWMNDTYCQCWAARREDAGGMLLLLDDSYDQVPLEQYYSDYHLPGGLLLFAVDKKSGNVLSSSDGKYDGVNAASIGLTEEVCGDGFVGDIMLDGRRCFVQTNAKEIRASVITADLSYLTSLYVPVVLKMIVAGLIVVLLMFWLVYICQKKTWKNLEPEQLPAGSKAAAGMETKAQGTRPGGKDFSAESRKEKKAEKEQQKEAQEEEEEREENASFYRERDGALRADRGAVGRWLNLKTPFRTQSADEKFHSLIHIGLAVLFVLGFILYERNSTDGIMGSTIAYLMQRTWQKGVNVYAITYAILVVLAIFVISLIIRRLIVMIGKNLGSRGETIARLISSFIGYASVIGAIVYSLMYLGMNTMALLASAGIIGLGISIGAKDLVADILAGIAIVFEGEFRTGDIVEISGYRGTVEDVGIRTTKVMSMGNVKVFRNSEVSGVVNLTQRYSIASVKVAVSRAEHLEEVEKIFKKELPHIRKKIPQAVEDISMGGIAEVNHAYVVLVFSTKCRESDRYGVERTLTREFELLMEREHIGSWGLGKVPEGYVPPPSS